MQLYATQYKGSVTRPDKELKAFKKVYLKKGESKTILLTVSKEDLGFYDVKGEMWYREVGYYALLVGRSSRQIKLA